MATPPISFRIFPKLGSSKHYYTVMVFRTASDMRQEAKKHYRHSLRGVFRAACVRDIKSKKVEGRLRRTNSRGAVLFHFATFDSGTVAHELLHAALYYSRTTKVALAHLQVESNDVEETLAEMIESLTYQLYGKCAQKGIIVPPVAGFPLTA